MHEADLAPFAFLWEGSAPEWCIRATYVYERRIVVLFDPPGPSARDVAAMREVFDELRGRSVQAVWADVVGKTHIPLAEVYSPVNAPSVVVAARRRGLRVDMQAIEIVHRIPVNRRTEQALIIESDELAARVVERMLAAGVPCEHVEVD